MGFTPENLGRSIMGEQKGGQQLYQAGPNIYVDNQRAVPYADQTGRIIETYKPPKDLQFLYVTPSEERQVGGFAGTGLLSGDPEDKTPGIAIYNNSPYKMRDNNEFKFMIAHELEHVRQNHAGKGKEQYAALAVPNASSSGLMFMPYTQKRQEREADLGGQRAYLNAGYDPSLFDPKGKGAVSGDGKWRSTLSPFDTHPNEAERGAYLKQGFLQWVTEKDNAEKMGNFMSLLSEKKKQGRK